MDYGIAKADHRRMYDIHLGHIMSPILNGHIEIGSVEMAKTPTSMDHNEIFWTVVGNDCCRGVNMGFVQRLWLVFFGDYTTPKF